MWKRLCKVIASIEFKNRAQLPESSVCKVLSLSLSLSLSLRSSSLSLTLSLLCALGRGGFARVGGLEGWECTDPNRVAAPSRIHSFPAWEVWKSEFFND